MIMIMIIIIIVNDSLNMIAKDRKTIDVLDK